MSNILKTKTLEMVLDKNGTWVFGYLIVLKDLTKVCGRGIDMPLPTDPEKRKEVLETIKLHTKVDI